MLFGLEEGDIIDMSKPTLPSIATILQSTEVLSNRDASATVVKVGEQFAVKYGGIVDPLEAENAIFVAQNSSVPVPKVYGTLSEEGTKRNFIIMELIPGEPLHKAWPNLTPSEKEEVVSQIRKAMLDLRGIPSPGYIGSVNRHACSDGPFWTPEAQRTPLINGPFDNEEEMNEGMLRKLALSEKPSYVDFLRTLISSTLYSHRTFFTHGDLQMKNILVQKPDGTEEGEKAPLKITIIDWGTSGWYPEYWEFANATFGARFMPDWVDIVQRAMPVMYPHEHLMIQVIRGIFFW